MSTSWTTLLCLVGCISQVFCRTSSDNFLDGEKDVVIRLHNVHTPIEDEQMQIWPTPSISSKAQKRVMVVRVSVNLTFYIELEPQLDTRLHSRLERVHVRYENYTDSHPLHDVQKCQFIGRVISPVSGIASVNTCPNSTEAHAIMITDGGVFYLKPRLIEWRGDKDRPHVLTRLQSERGEQFCGLHTFKEEVPLDDMSHIAPSITETVETTPGSAKANFGYERSRLQTNMPEHENIIINSRRKRAAQGGIKYIETGIFVDRHMFDAVEKTKPPNTVGAIVNIVMAILHQVQLIYEYQSMTAYDFKIIVVKFEILRNTKTSPNTGSGNIDRYLDSFCAWQCKRLPATGSKDHWDHAILLTGLDMYKVTGSIKNDKVLGLAWVNGMCRCDYSCTINEGNSAEAAFVIAHEMGHSLGMQHDGSGNTCDSNKYIMSDRTGAGKVNWSKCSNDYVKNAERKGQYKCLANEAKPASPAVDIAKLPQLPGEEYSALQQCQMALSPKHKPYTTSSPPFNDICRELWCLEGQWATPAHPALDGTSCSSGKWCRQGTCVVKSSSRQTQAPATSERRAKPTQVSGRNRQQGRRTLRGRTVSRIQRGRSR
ncbi:A disintegrin and metalloproteinase with thrombospondin motifs adt-1-like isoform X4 [Varroa destructor]|uniref:Peptidase M12B domain-containing protein n=1 Tax=Varroa destructor TaxID=109461 RepID=A0A7M7MFG4_VARDE|nr:A disintegrin and metalloproteinase with thrombospondin motifs adt-1-like isoform X4 [Varroa destructor]